MPKARTIHELRVLRFIHSNFYTHAIEILSIPGHPATKIVVDMLGIQLLVFWDEHARRVKTRELYPEETCLIFGREPV